MPDSSKLLAQQSVGSPSGLYSLDPGFVQVRDDLSGQLTRKLEVMSPESKAVVESNIKMCDPFESILLHCTSSLKAIANGLSSHFSSIVEISTY